MSKSTRGLYEVLVTEALEARLRELESRLQPNTSALRPAEAPDRIALHLSRLIQRALAALGDADRVAAGVDLARTLIDDIQRCFETVELGPDRPVAPGLVLRSITSLRPDGSPETIAEPLIPLLDTTLLTNAPGEPRVGSQLATEIHSADRIDVVMAFIRRSGIAPMLDALRAVTARQAARSAS